MIDPPLDWWSTYFDAEYLVEHAPMFTERRTRREVGRAVTLLGLPVGSAVLDAPCGQGRHATLLAGAGFAVTGVDYSRTLLAIARRRRDAKPAFVHGDIRALPTAWSEKFDGVVSLGASFGFFATPSEDEAVLASYGRVLRGGGTLVLHMPNRDGTAANFVERDWWESGSGKRGALVLHERELDPVSGVLTVRTQIRRGERTTHRAYRLRLYNASEVAAMGARQGLVLIDAWDGWRERPLRRRSREMILRFLRDG